MYVKNRMTVNPIVVHPDQTISEVLDLMKEHAIHRLPVTQNGKLVGLVTQSTINANTPSHLTTLSMHEMNYLLSKTKVSDIMIKRVFTVGPDTPIEEAADTMEKKDIGCLPVVGEADVLLGIITTGDILKAFVGILGYNEKGTLRVSARIPENKPGILADFAKIFADQGLSLTHVSLFEDAFHVRCEATDPKKLRKLLEDKGFKVTEMS